MNKTHETITTCRVCGSEALKKGVSLGNQRIVDFPQWPGTTDKPIVPLDLVMCENCKLVQLGCIINPDIMFREFWYRSGINEMMKAALKDIVVKSYEKANLRFGDMVLDIGSNDNTLLGMYPKEIVTVGFDPSNQIMSEEAILRASYSVQNYFNYKEANDIAIKEGKKYKLITSIAMFYDINDPAEFLNQVKSLLTEDGMLVIQMNYLLTMLEQNAFDNISHEHATYYSLATLKWLLIKCGLYVVDVELNDVNGGSIRVYIKKLPISMKEISSGATGRIKEVLDREKNFGLDNIEALHNFGKRIKGICDSLIHYIVARSVEGNPVYAYGASTRGTTLLQTIGELPLAGVAERDENKYGRYMVSGWLKIHPEDYIRRRCKYMLCLPWHFESGIIEREKEWLENGGTFIFPLPEPHLITIEVGVYLMKKLASEVIKENSDAPIRSTTTAS